MTDHTSPALLPGADDGATAVITHHIKPGMDAQYEAWLKDIAAASRIAEGVLDWQVVRPVPGLTNAYTVILRFGSHEHLQHWMRSPERAAHIERARPFLARDDEFFIRSGLDFWFVPQGARAKLPVRWKQFLVTWSAIFPLSLLTSQLVMPLLYELGLPRERYLNTLLASGLVVLMMVYVVMPRYTRLVQRWLFDHGTP